MLKNRLGVLAGAVIGVVVLSTALSACGADSTKPEASGCEPSSDPVTLEYWSWIPGIEDAVAEFNDTHPGITVNVNVVAGSEAYDKIFKALKAGDQPDLAMIEYQSLPSFQFQDGLRDISECEPVKDLADRVEKWTYEQVSFGSDALYATPTDVAPLAYYYRQDLFEANNIAVPKTWDEFRAAAEQLKEADPKTSIASFSSQDASLLLSLIWQNGGKPFTYDDKSIVVDLTSPEALEVAEFWQGMIDDGLVNTDIAWLSGEQFTAFGNGTLASSVAPVWQSALMEASSTEAAGLWHVSPIPQWDNGEEKSANQGGATTAVLRGTEHPYEAAVFADWLSTNPQARAYVYGAGGLSAAIDAKGDPEISEASEYFGGQAFREVFQEASAHIDSSFQWAPNQTNVTDYLTDGLVDVLAGSSTIPEVLANVQAKTVSDLESQGITVRVK